VKCDIILGYPSWTHGKINGIKKITWYRYLRPRYCFIVNSYCLIVLPIAAVFWSDCQDKDVIWPHQIFQVQKHFLEIVHGKLTAAIIKSLFLISYRAGALSLPVLLVVGYSRLIHALVLCHYLVVGKKVLHLLLQAYLSPLCLWIIGLAGLSTLEWSCFQMWPCCHVEHQGAKATAFIVSPS
jgi:hypothetical protein